MVAPILVAVALLSGVMGLTLGMLGGGGSILAVPILLYVAGLGATEAIATSLLVVGATSAACTISHARAGHVRWRTGLVFGGFAMVGAYLGGWAARFVPETILLLAFAAMMVAAALAMLRRRDKPRPQSGRLSVPVAAAEGLVVGAVTGLVGAGGGFMVVPALVVIGGLGMREAVGTSSLVITMKAAAGFAGYATHVAIDPTLATVAVVPAVLASVFGARLAHRIAPARLKQGFARLILVMAVLVVGAEVPASWRDALFVERWPFWAGGLAIGLFVLFFARGTGKALGMSTGFEDVCRAQRTWRWPLMVGVVAGGALASVLSGTAPTMSMGAFDTLFGSSLLLKGVVFTLGGVLVGFGARMAGGCTSGHGIVGTAQLAPSSLITTGVFMASGFVVTHLLIRLSTGWAGG